MEKIVAFLAKISNGHTELAILIIAIILIKHIITTLILTRSAKLKGHNEFGYFILCLLLWNTGYCITASLRDKKPKRKKRNVDEESIVLENILQESSNQILPAKNEPVQAPKGAVAYMNQTSNSHDMSEQEIASDRLKEYWGKK